MSIVQQLIDMGFPSDKATVAAGNDRTIDQALNYIENDGVGFEPIEMETTSAEEANSEENKNTPTTAVSFQCDDCGKFLANDEAMMRHIAVTKHIKFSESTKKELTPDEKAEQLAEICRKLKENKEKKAAAEVVEAKTSEIERRTAGQAMASYREEAREREVREAARLRVLQKAEDAEAKKKILEQIRLDQEERKARAAGYVAPVKASEAVAPPPPKDYTVTNIQFRLLDGSVVKQEFKVDEPLMMLRGWIESNFAKGTPFTLMTPFPRKVFTEEDMGTPLHALKLVPSASLVLLNRTV